MASRNTPRRLALLAACAALFVATPAFAFDFGVGVEGAGTLSLSNNLTGSAQTATSLALGLILEERFNLAVVELTIWEDAQMPYALNITQDAGGGGNASNYVPIDAGLRLGLGFSPFRPYVGVLVNDNILTSGDGSGNFFGLGGDIGIDIAVIFLRFGLDLRAFWNVTDVTSGSGLYGPGATLASGGLMLQAILSARFSF